MIEPQAQKRGIGYDLSAIRTPYSSKPIDPSQAGSNQPAVQRDQVQQPGGAVVVEYTLPPAGFDSHLRPGHRAGLSPEQLAQLFQPFNRLGKEAGGEEGHGHSAWW